MVKEINGVDEFKKEVVEHKGVIVVDFWAPWCGPCKLLGPIFEKFSSQYKKIKFAKVNVDENQDLQSDNGVMGIPCVIFFRDGEEADRMIGFNGEDSLKVKLNTFM